MKCIVGFLIACVIGLQGLSAQTTRGLGMPVVEGKQQQGKTYALIVGISKYQNTSIPPLQYPDKDAMAFYQYLKASGVDTSDIILLLNEKARNAEFWADVNYFTEVAKPADKLYIYFSGHGDVESKTITRDAYLLPYDAPKVTYASGAISIYLLKGYLETISANNVQVIFISDACHAGNLAGGRAGMEATAAVLKDQWRDEIKILSCQPGELSIEGKQWGGGRGLFSYELINGLAGKADKNNDGKVTLRELNLYLTDKVPDGASPMAQNPVLEGKPETIMSIDNEPVLSAINNGASSSLSMVDVKGFETTWLKGSSAGIKNSYASFTTCMDTGNYASYPDAQLSGYVFGGPTDSIKILPSALYYLRQIPVNDSTLFLLAYMRRNLAAALMAEVTDTSATAIGKILQGKNPEVMMRQLTNYLNAVQLNAVALEQLLGRGKLKKLGIYSNLVFTQVTDASMVEDSAEFNMPYNLALLDTAIMADPNNARLYFLQGTLLQKAALNKEAIVRFEKAIDISPSLTASYTMIGISFKRLNQMDSVLYYGHKGMQVASDNPFATRIGFIMLLSEMGERDSLNFYLQTIDNYFPSTAPPQMAGNMYVMLATVALKSHLTNQVIRLANKINDDDANIFFTSKYLLLASAYALDKDKETALKYLKTALQKGYKFYERIQTNPNFDFIRNDPEYKALMKEYFPTEYKE